MHQLDPDGPIVDDQDAPSASSDDEAPGPVDRADPASPAPPERRSAARRPVPLVAWALVVALVFGAGVGVGRVTAPVGSDGSGGGAPTASAGASGAAGGGAAAGSAAPGSAPASGAAASSAASSAGALDGLPANGPLLGRRDAKVQLTYWADYQCPFCARFAQQVLPQLASRIADGTVSVLHRDFVFLGPESVDAAIAVRCGGDQGRYWPMHDTVYGMQAGENQGAFTLDRLGRIAGMAGLDATAFAACVNRHDILVDVLADTAAGVRAGVTSTPTVDLPGQRLLGVPDVTTLLHAIDAAAASGASPTPGPTAPGPSGDPWAATPVDGLAAGSPSAPVTVELWVDYQATGMPALVQNLEPGLRTRVAAGKVRLRLRDLASLGDESVLAATFARCGASGGERTVWFAHDILGVSAKGANAGVFTTRNLLWLGAKLGWDVAALDTCMANPTTTAAIRDETAAGRALGLAAAPGVVIKAGGKEVVRFSGSSLDAARILAAVDKAR